MENLLPLNSPSNIGTWIGIKVVLIAVTILLALHARLRILPDLTADRLRALAWHIVPVTVIAVLLVITGVAIRFEAAG